MRTRYTTMGTATALGLALLLAAAPARAQTQGRPDVSGTRAAVTAGHPLAAAAGAEVLRRGGNAVDAAITMAGVLAVVRPHMNGVGGDAFLLIRDAATGEVHALNGSGRAGSRATPSYFEARGLHEIPTYGVLAVSVPGAVAGWADALERFGTLSLAEALAPAIRYADEGFPVSRKLAEDIAAARDRLLEDPGLAATFLRDGAVPEPGTVLRQPALAGSLRAIAREGKAGFYRGEIAASIARFMEEEDGLITADDLAGHTSTWTRPLRTLYRGRQVLAFPPNTQGLALLLQLNMAEETRLAELEHNSADYVDLMVALKELAFADRDRYVTDPAFSDVPVERLISKEYARERVRDLRTRRSTDASGDRSGAGTPSRREGEDDTVFLSALDAQGNAVSMIESLFHAFGSGRMVPGTGIILHNRGALFELDRDHVNVVAPGKRTYHTLSPHMVLEADGALAMLLGTPGGDGQTQTMMQVLHAMELFGMMPQQAIEAPRWRSYSDGRLAMEPGFGDAVYRALEQRGLRVERRDRQIAEFGNAQVIFVHPESGAILTGADLRREGYAIAW